MSLLEEESLISLKILIQNFSFYFDLNPLIQSSSTY